MYYLQSRYYDPEIRRFISADGLIGDSLAATNLYVYTCNNPVNMQDPGGNEAIILGYLFCCGMAALGVLACVGIVSIANGNRISVPTIHGFPSLSSGPFSDAMVSEETETRFNDFRIRLGIKYKVISLHNHSGYCDHHIVQQGGLLSAPARYCLQAVVINPKKNGANIVRLSKAFHISIHATGKLYALYSNSGIVFAYYCHDPFTTDEDAVRKELARQAYVLYEIDPEKLPSFALAYDITMTYPRRKPLGFIS